MQATRALIHLENLRSNIAAVRRAVGPRVRLCMCVKADAYGHGAGLVSRIAREQGVYALGVANVQEGILLRRAGMEGPIYVFGNPLPEEMPDAIKHDLAPFLADEEGIARIGEWAERLGRRAAVHLKIDTGMGRLGCTPQEAPELASRIDSHANLSLCGVCTHFAGADMRERGYTEAQIALFDRTLSAIRELGIDPGLAHAANSGAVIGYPEAHLDMVRVGIAFYGYYPSSEQERTLALRPVLELRTRVSFVKRVPAGTSISYGMTHTTRSPTIVATLPVGYGDGYSRALSGCGEVLIRGRRHPIVGRVCMDQCMVDLGPGSGVRAGEEVVLFGPDPSGPDAEEIANRTGTIPYEVTCRLTGRVPRIAVDRG